MFRFLKVRGKPGCIVPNPHGEARRYVGKTPKVFPPDAPRDASLSLVDMYDDTEEVIRDEPSIRRAIPKHLDLVATGIGKSADSVVWSAGDVPLPVAVPEKSSKPKGN